MYIILCYACWTMRTLTDGCNRTKVGEVRHAKYFPVKYRRRPDPPCESTPFKWRMELGSILDGPWGRKEVTNRGSLTRGTGSDGPELRLDARNKASLEIKEGVDVSYRSHLMLREPGSH